MQERSEALLQKVKKVAPTYRTRPSLVAPVSSAAAFSLGAVSAVLPQNLRNAVSGVFPAQCELSGARVRKSTGWDCWDHAARLWTVTWLLECG